MSFDLDFLYNMNEGPLRSGLIVLGVALVAVVVAVFLHRVGIAVVRRLARGRPFTTTATEVTFSASRTCVAATASRSRARRSRRSSAPTARMDAGRASAPSAGSRSCAALSTARLST